MPTRSNLGPLTTAFTYPASCTLNVVGCITCGLAWQAQTCSDNPANTQGVEDNPDCWPPRAADNGLATVAALNGWGFYSPAFRCPVGYTTACSATGTAANGFAFQFPILDSETAIGCCPP